MTLLESLDNPWRRPPALSDPRDLRCLLELAAAVVFDVSPDRLRAASRGSADIAFARQSAMYLAHIVLGMSYSAIGKLFGCDRTTAAHACQTVEDRRDDPAIDIRLDLMEVLCGDVVFGDVGEARP
jgi:Bacterial dnaA protein helix-turn-helix